MIEVEKLRELLRYEPETGVFFWLPRSEATCGTKHETDRWNTRYSGKEPFPEDFKGYRRIQIFRKRYLAHRVAWAIYTGKWPAEQIDHINGDRSDNRIANLREASRAENNRNKSSSAGSTSQYVGVSWCNKNLKWKVGIWHTGKQHHIGYFQSEVDAASAYDREAQVRKGMFAKINLA